MDEVCITISKGDVIVFPFEMFCRLLVQVVNISKRHIPCFPSVLVLGLARFSGQVRSIEDSLDLAWRVCFRLLILWSRPPIIDIVFQVPTTDKLLYLILQGDALLGGVADVSMKSAKLVLIPFGAIST